MEILYSLARPVKMIQSQENPLIHCKQQLHPSKPLDLLIKRFNLEQFNRSANQDPPSQQENSKRSSLNPCSGRYFIGRDRRANLSSPGSTLLLHLARFEKHVQCWLIPECKELLIVSPASALWGELHIEVEDDTGKYEAQFDERKTEKSSQHHRSRASLASERTTPLNGYLLHPNTVSWSV